VLGPQLRMLREVADAYADQARRRLPINGAGAAGATLADAGIPPDSVRGFVLIARTAGLVGHLAEEADSPVGMPLWLEVEDRARPDT
jgi:citrate synthase